MSEDNIDNLKMKCLYDTTTYFIKQMNIFQMMQYHLNQHTT